METGDFWNVDDPLKPWGLFDPDAVLVFPIDVSGWLEGMAGTYASHQVLADAPLEVLSSAHADSVVSIRIALVTDPEYVSGVKYPFTLRIVATDGQQDDRTFWLKVKPR